VKRRELVRAILAHGAVFMREGAVEVGVGVEV